MHRRWLAHMSHFWLQLSHILDSFEGSGKSHSSEDFLIGEK